MFPLSNRVFQRKICARNIIYPLVDLWIQTLRAGLTALEHQLRLGPEAADMLSLCETRHELSVVVDELTYVFAVERVLRYGAEDFEVDFIGGNVDFLE